MIQSYVYMYGYTYIEYLPYYGLCFAYISGIQSVSPSGELFATPYQPVTLTCVAQGIAVLWFANGRHVSEVDLELVESDTVLLDSGQCLRQRNLTWTAIPHPSINITCYVPGTLMPSPQIVLHAEGAVNCMIEEILGTTRRTVCVMRSSNIHTYEFWQ